MALAGLDYRALAKAVDRDGMGEHTLRNWANPKVKKWPQPHDLRYIAEACGLSTSFFTIDFATLDSLASDEIVSEMSARLEKVEKRLEAARLEELAGELEALRQSEAAGGGEEDPP